MQLNKVDITGELRVTYNDGAEVWDRQIALFPSNKAKMLQDYYNLHWFDLINGTEFGSNISEDIALTGILLGMGDGATTSFSGTLPAFPVKENTVTIYHTVGASAESDATDDGSGNITGTNVASASVTYVDGTWTVAFTTAPDDGEPITMDYTRGVVADDSIATGFTFDLTTDATPVLDEAAFSVIVPLTVAPATVDRYEQSGYIIYEVTMTATYAGADTDIVTALGLNYVATSGDGSEVTASSNFLAKSTALLNNAIYDGGLVLMNESIITATYRVKVSK